MPKSSLISVAKIKVGGKDTPKEMVLVSVEVDESVLIPSMFSIRLFDPDFKWTDDSSVFGLGKEVEIKIGGPDQNDATLLKGEITAIEPEFSGKEPIVIIRGYDKSHRLHMGKKSRTFVNMKDSDIAGKIAGENGFSTQLDATSVVHEVVCQDYQTDMEFLLERARRSGRHVYVNKSGQLCFVKLPQGGGDVSLKWGEELQDLHARLTAEEQMTSVKVHGWDTKKKEAIVSQKGSYTNEIGDQVTGGKEAKDAFGVSGEEVIWDRPVNTVDEADALAQSIFNEKGNTLIQAEGTCIGNPDIGAGTIVELKGIGNRFSGRYRVSRAIHRYDDAGHYSTWFEISGWRANTLGQLLAGREQKTSHGVVVGVVTNLEDPDDFGRIKVKFPQLGEQGSELESGWARLVSPMAGQERGIEFLPEVNDEVLVAFEHDDINRPYVVGALWNTKEKPPLAKADAVKNGKVARRVIKTTSGHIIAFDDESGKEKISIIDKTGKNSIEIDSTKNQVSIKTEKANIDVTSGSGTPKIDVVTGSNSISIDGTSNKVTVKGGTELVINAPKITIEATSQMNIKSSGQMNIEGAMTTLKGNATTTVQGGAMTEIKGGIVKIN